MTDLKGAHGMCYDVKKTISRGVTKIIIEIPIEYHIAATQMFDNQSVWVELAPLEIKGRPYAVIDGSSKPLVITQEELDDATREKIINDAKPYGKAASELYRAGFFYNPSVLKAIGTDEEFLEWIRQQPCAMTGEFDRNEDGQGNFIERCEAAHVRRIANGAGTAEKPPYSAIPLVRFWHGAQTKFGERVFDTSDLHRFNIDGDPIKGRAWADRQRNFYLTQWAGHKLAETLGTTSMGLVPPPLLKDWAEEHDLQMFLPAAYK